MTGLLSCPRPKTTQQGGCRRPPGRSPPTRRHALAKRHHTENRARKPCRGFGMRGLSACNTHSTRFPDGEGETAVRRERTRRGWFPPCAVAWVGTANAGRGGNHVTKDAGKITGPLAPPCRPPAGRASRRRGGPLPLVFLFLRGPRQANKPQDPRFARVPPQHRRRGSRSTCPLQAYHDWHAAPWSTINSHARNCGGEVGVAGAGWRATPSRLEPPLTHRVMGLPNPDASDDLVPLPPRA